MLWKVTHWTLYLKKKRKTSPCWFFHFWITTEVLSAQSQFRSVPMQTSGTTNERNVDSSSNHVSGNVDLGSSRAARLLLEGSFLVSPSHGPSTSASDHPTCIWNGGLEFALIGSKKFFFFCDCGPLNSNVKLRKFKCCSMSFTNMEITFQLVQFQHS